jgi:hypothetical protein
MGKTSYRVNSLECDENDCTETFNQSELEGMKALIKKAKTAGWKVNKKKRGGKIYCPKHVPVKVATPEVDE